jgi:hypothetical protein
MAVGRAIAILVTVTFKVWSWCRHVNEVGKMKYQG